MINLFSTAAVAVTNYCKNKYTHLSHTKHWQLLYVQLPKVKKNSLLPQQLSWWYNLLFALVLKLLFLFQQTVKLSTNYSKCKNNDKNGNTFTVYICSIFRNYFVGHSARTVPIPEPMSSFLFFFNKVDKMVIP